MESFCLEKDSILNQITVYLLEPLILQIFKRPDDEKCLEVGFNLLNYLLTHHASDCNQSYLAVIPYF